MNSWCRWRGHALADHRAVEHVERGEQGGGAVALIVVGHGAGAALLHRQAGLRAVERLDLATSRRPTARGCAPAGRHRARPRRCSLAANAGSLDSLKGRTRCGCSPCAAQIRCTEAGDTPASRAIARTVQWVASPGGGASVRRPPGRPARRQRRDARGPGLVAQQPVDPGLEVALLPAPDAGLGLPVRRMISAVPTRPPSAARSCARQTCFCGLFRSATIAANRARSGAESQRQQASRIRETWHKNFQKCNYYVRD